MLDEATVYNASHLFGFVSIFNADAIKSLEVYKGGFPSQYGGRLSSVLDIQMKEGNREKRENRMSLGLLSSSILLEGPLKKGRSSYFFSGRASYWGLIGLPIYLAYRAGSSDAYLNYWLYDINMKSNHTFKDKSQLYISLYQGLDDYRSNENNPSGQENSFGLNWGNTTSTIRYNRLVGTKAFLKGIVSFSDYAYRVEASESSTLSTSDTTLRLNESTSISSHVRDIHAKLSLEMYPWPTHRTQVGAEALAQRFQPGIIRLNDESPAPQELSLQTFYSQTYNAYIGHEAHLFSRLDLYAGLRGTVFQIEDTSMQALEPRISLGVRLTNNWSAHASYSIMNQYMHLLSSNGVGLPNDIWVPATGDTGPSMAEQYSAGLALNLPDIPLSFTLEAYYKTLNGLIDYRAGGGGLTNLRQDWQEQIEVHGSGKAYGLEMLMNKQAGKLSGWLAYTLSWNQQQFEAINGGAWYPGRFDRRHDISISSSLKANSRWTFAATWVYTSGAPVTLPIAVLRDLNGREQLVFQDRNNGRFPAYHRLDLGAEFTVKPTVPRSPVWRFSIYNFYNRRNPFTLQLNRRATGSGAAQIRQYRAVQRSLFPFLPSISYSWSF